MPFVMLFDEQGVGMRLFRSAKRFSETPSTVRRVPPTLGEHTDEVLSEAGSDAVTIASPVRQRLGREARKGRPLFSEAGCDVCHIPFLETQGRVLEYRFPDDPFVGEVFYAVDLSGSPTHFRPTRRGGIRVPLFADLKRHDMGPELAESFGSELDSSFTTARLWGIWDTAPYLHDGRATTLVEAITLHGGEARDARAAFVAFSDDEKSSLLAFLATLRTPTDATRGLAGIE